ncbi:MAG: AMP-binding protein [Planctomycetota bacterium]
MSDAAITVVEVEPGVDPMPAFEAIWSRGARALPLARTLPAAARAALEARVRAMRATPAPGVILATSGSSGVPRLVDLSLEAMEASARAGVRAIPFGPGDVWHASLAPSHVGGVMILMRARVLGGAVRFGAQPRAWRDLEGCTHVSLVAAQLARLLEDRGRVPSSLKAVMLGGGPSAQSLRDAAIARGVPLFATYGLTETCSQVATGPLAPGDPATLAGPALPGASIAIEPATGEILVDGPMLARGEFVAGDDGAATLVPLARPLSTRDAGFLDAAGRLHVVGRLDAMFISGGKNIHPEAIERALCELPCVRAACVVGVPDAKWGMRPVAFVDLRTQTGRFIREILGETLERHLVPDAVYAMPVDEIAATKPSRARLAARLAAGQRFNEV